MLDLHENFPLYWACDSDNTEIIRLLMDYATENNIILELNAQNKKGFSLLLTSCIDNNIEMVHFLMNYAMENHIQLELNEKDKANGIYPLLMTCGNDNIEMLNEVTKINKNYPLSAASQLLMKYAQEKNIILKLSEKDLDENVSEMSDEMVILFNNYENIIDITYENENNKKEKENINKEEEEEESKEDKNVPETNEKKEIEKMEGKEKKKEEKEIEIEIEIIPLVQQVNAREKI
ncbi:hypothetical protein PIROE2DRAFT_5998 [Piromyces sp. E2]|nr:hypothetical protein PIROE2DRAFT_5998 [Piromyces sp. E2]|eukprot:OUM66687.1 hypothetical protein PIROE2DRAFT_5998 [Piromyces sp. E2]